MRPPKALDRLCVAISGHMSLRMLMRGNALGSIHTQHSPHSFALHRMCLLTSHILFWAARECLRTHLCTPAERGALCPVQKCIVPLYNYDQSSFT